METENSGDHLSRAARDVYFSCDVSSENSVCVSTLLRFINSSDWGHVFEFAQLEEMLDPHRTDPCLTCEEFVRIVTQWSNGHETNFRLETQPSLHSCNGSTHHSPDSEYVRALELKYENSLKKIENLRSQLAAAEEQNDLLQMKCEENVPASSSKIELKEAEIEQANVPDCVAELKSIYENHIFKLKRSVEFYEKEVTALNKTILKQSDEKKNLEQKIKIFDQKLKDQTKVLCNLEVELDRKEKSIASLVDGNRQLESKLSQQEEYINHYTEMVNVLDDGKKALESSVHEHISECSLYAMQLNCTPRRRSLNSDHNPLAGVICKYNSPRLLYNLQNPVSPNLDSPRADKINNNDVEILSPIESCGCASDKDVLSDAGEDTAQICNITDVNLANTLRLLCNGRRRDSLSDEILLADQDFHRNECLQLITQQKSQIAELEESIEQSNATIEQLTERLDDNQARIATLTSTGAEQAERCATLLEQLRASDAHVAELTAKSALLEELPRTKGAPCDEANAKHLRMTNFNKMEVKLERREEQIEELRKLLKLESANYAKLVDERNGLERALNAASRKYVRVKNEVTTLKSEHARFTEGARAVFAEFNVYLATLAVDVLKFNFESLQSQMICNTFTDFDCSELDQVSDQISDSATLTASDELLRSVTNAYDRDSETLERRLQTQATVREKAERVLLDVFENVKLLLTSVDAHLSTERQLLSHRLLENARIYCANAVDVTIKYGKLLGEHSQLKILGAVINHSRRLESEVSRPRQLGSIERLSYGICKFGLCFVFIFLISYLLLMCYLVISGRVYVRNYPAPI